VKAFNQVRILHAIRGHQVGDVVCYSSTIARELVVKGLAEWVPVDPDKLEASSGVRIRFLADAHGQHAGDVAKLSKSVGEGLIAKKLAELIN
jgi:hypothetical protein